MVAPSEPSPYEINISEESLHDLRRRLEQTRFPDELEDAGWEYGAPLSDVRRLAEYWKDGFDWRKKEAELNASLKQFTLDISVEGQGTLNVHFLHHKSDIPNAIPLLFIHGWPGNFLEAIKLIPNLTSPPTSENPAFHVVVISLPGYTFSEAPHKKGFAIAQFAEAGHNLMLALGYEQYVVQGGDWGSVIASEISLRYGGKYCKAVHVNMILTNAPKFSRSPLLWLRNKLTPYTPDELAGLARSSWYNNEGKGYFIEQGTQPETLAYSLADSPVGLLGWIYEKLVKWTDDYAWSDDEILTWVSLYWHSRSGPGASIRIYYELMHTPGFNGTLGPSPVYSVPIGLSQFPKDAFVYPALWAKAYGRVVQYTRHTRGGHFASTEVPELLLDDLWKMFGNGGPANGVFSVHSGREVDTQR
ncbi:hypothetical protein M0805_006610 [Coniferiporia weirii]|nr:hypothetical protein M0805_006610 [Coniferiporia weirii]